VVRPGSRRSVLVVVLGLCLLGAGVLVATDLGTTAENREPRIPHQLVEPRPEDNVIWPYTSATRSPAEPRLALNVVVHGDADRLRAVLTHGADASWNETVPADDGQTGARPGADGGAAAVSWDDARGANRYVYVHDYALTEPVNETTRRPNRALSVLSAELNETIGGRWIAETYQLHDGDYFGDRDHLRAYASPYESDGWVAVQAHSEHWDWFRLRHTVHGIDGAQEHLESDLMGRWYVDDVWRMYVHNDGGPNSDGWVTVIDLDDPSPASPADLGAVGLGLVLAVGIDRRRRLQDREVDYPVARLESTADRERPVTARVVDRLLATLGPRRFLAGLRLLSYGVLFLSLFGLFTLVRSSGVFLERQFPGLHPELIAGSLYLVIAVGLPLCARRFGREVPPVQSFALAASGIGAAMVLDYTLLGIEALPITIVLHRAGIAVALGLIAAGSTRTVRDTSPATGIAGYGLLLWLLLLGLGLADLL